MSQSRFNWMFVCATAWILMAMAPQARAIYIVTFAQVGPDVVATGGGSINTAGLTFAGSASSRALVLGSIAGEVTGPAVITSTDTYTGFSGPTSFGSGGAHFATSGSGSLVGLQGNGGIMDLPTGYISGAALSDTATYAGQTFASLGLTPGTYTYTFGSGATADSFIVNIGVAAVPEPRTILGGMAGLLGLGGMAIVRRHRGAKTA